MRLAKGGPVKVPAVYRLDKLAQRWGIPPWELEQAPEEWLIRGMLFMSFEAEASEVHERKL